MAHRDRSLSLCVCLSVCMAGSEHPVGEHRHPHRGGNLEREREMGTVCAQKYCCMHVLISTACTWRCARTFGHELSHPHLSSPQRGVRGVHSSEWGVEGLSVGRCRRLFSIFGVSACGTGKQHVRRCMAIFGWRAYLPAGRVAATDQPRTLSQAVGFLSSLLW